MRRAPRIGLLGKVNLDPFLLSATDYDELRPRVRTTNHGRAETSLGRTFCFRTATGSTHGSALDAQLALIGDHPPTWSEPLMNIFVSWSGSTSHGLARVLKDWLPTVLPFARPWLSSEDIRKGKPWDPELTTQLEATSYSIVCVTAPGVARAPWVNFEAGVVSKYIEHAHVSPLLVGVSPEDLAGLPLARFQCTEFTKTDVAKLLRSINETADSPVSGEKLTRNLRNTWRQLQEDVEELDLSEGPDSREEEDEHYDDEEDDANYVFLEEIEEQILALVAHMDPSRPTVDDIFSHMAENRIRVRHYLDRLVESKVLYHHSYVGRAGSYSATAAGRKYLVEHDLV